ncbi:aminobenzoyl-glutamate transporter [Halolactibacillus alkaliphilus]|uniref:Aminobenzoyl-glutamate transporter n=1 Tax=Halolactibacillus alkaliphilus TaxID=442899 RepID=A0A511X1E0_9BACI|nr:AbgT family transporter [Halolactibacillus alkaliphilus]GEN56755.1 aminobenzoyl-glutamate transporter [Halolactibacillus alkaliphilus]GGN70825.1 aminobenzoyl-glutamate transporter [Halolactibacillus alkaliphilus]SFO79849.1 aminobenzoyl-glutamate transport protein [Halolactibacillus alkaliphilus]
MSKKKRSLFQRFLDTIETTGNRLPHPVTLFAILSVLVVIASAIVAATGITVEHPGNPGEMIEARSLLSREGVVYIFTSMVNNFINFAPLGVVLASMLGIGLAERSGLISASLRGFVLSIPKSLITAGLVFAGVMSSLASDAGYVVLPPLGAVIFIALGRHPIAGIAAAFAGVSAGFSANLLLTSLDPMLAEMTISAAAIIDPAYAENMNVAMNYYFVIASVFLLTIVGAVVTEKVVEPRLGTYQGSIQAGDMTELSVLEKKGLRYSGISLLITVIAIALLVVPSNGLLRAEDGGVISSPFMSSLVPIIMIMFFVPGLVYGKVTKTINNDREMAAKLSDTMASMGMFIVLAFTAGQFVSYFTESNLGLLIGVAGAEFLDSIKLGGIVLIILFILISGFINLFIGSASAKWAMMAPVFVPIMMQQGYSPELTQMAYRIADSTSNIISPLMPYFAMIIVIMQKYNKKMGIGTLISTMFPYTIFFTITWIVMLVVWMLFGWDLGPGSPIHYVIQ